MYRLDKRCYQKPSLKLTIFVVLHTVQCFFFRYHLLENIEVPDFCCSFCIPSVGKKLYESFTNVQNTFSVSENAPNSSNSTLKDTNFSPHGT